MDTRDAVARWLELRTWRAFDVDDDGRVLAGHDDGGCLQLVEVDPRAGTRTPLTALPSAVTGRYLRGERTVVVQHDTDGDENHQLSLLPLDPLPHKPFGLSDLTPLVRADGVKHTLLDVQPGRVVYSSNARNGVDFDVLVRDLATAEDRVLYDGGGSVAESAVSPDGSRVVVAMMSLVAMSTHLLLVGQDGVEPLTDAEQPGRHERVAWAPDGQSLLVTTDAETDHTLVSRYDLERRRWMPVVAHDDWDVAGWPSPDGSLLLVETLVDGESRLALHDAVTGALHHRVDLPGGGTAAAGVVAYHPLPDPVWSPDSRSVALSFWAPGVPGDVLLLDATTGRLTPVTDSAAQVEGGEASLPASHRIPTADGELVPCFVHPPTAEVAELAGASVVVIHGGPEGQSVRGFNPVVQALAGTGLTVLVPNVRGSTGYGRRWYSLDDGPRRLDSVADLAALHDALPGLGLDPARSALWGGSYGGYMVLAGLTFQPQRWAAGVDIVGISSLVTFLQNTSAYRRAFREREYGRLDTDREMLEAASPLPRIDEVRAPLFVIHGANDPRVPLSEAEQVAAAVRARGPECELRVYPDEGHGLAKRANRLDAYPAAVEFLGRHLARRT